MQRPCEELFSGPGLAFDEYRAVTLGHSGQDVEEFLHRGASADHVFAAILLLQSLSELLDDGHIAEGLHPADNPALPVFQDGT